MTVGTNNGGNPGMAGTESGIAAVAARLTSQDSRLTEHPMFVVEEKRRIYGVDVEYVSEGGHAGWGQAWLNGDGDEADADMTRWLDGLQGGPAAPAGLSWDKESHGPTDDWSLVGYVETWRFVTACLTEEGAKRYIEANRHELDDPRVFVYSAAGNREWVDVRAFVAAQDTQFVAAMGAEFMPDESNDDGYGMGMGP